MKGNKKPKLKGAQIFFEALRKEGVKHIFGYPGGATLYIYEHLYDIEDIQHILVRHEQGATHMAEGYAKASGKPGVVLVTSGPGATNTVTGIADAYMDSVPIVVFTGQVPTSLIGNDAFQEADICGITRPITKHNFLVKDVEELALTIKKAFYIATTGKPGPVVVDIPKNVSNSYAEFEYPETIELKTYKPVYHGHPNQIKKAAEAIKNHKKPLLYVGGGVVMSEGASEQLFKLATKLNIPVTMTLQGLGAFPGDHELSLGMLGMHGTYYANKAITDCDLLIAVGARFDDRVTGKLDTFSRHSYKIHIDIDPSTIDKNVKVNLPIVGDSKNILEELNKYIDFTIDTSEWLKQIDEWKKECPLAYTKGDGKLRTEYVIDVLSNLTKGEAIIVPDVGQHQMWVAQFYKFKYPRTFITSGGLGTMGFSVPAAIGAAFAVKDKPVISISGDGGFQMNIQELITAAYYKIPVKFFIINNGYLGMVRQWQELFHSEKYSFTNLQTSNPDFVKVSEAMGVKALRCDNVDCVEDVIKQALEYNEGPITVEFRVVKEDMVYPMVPAGASVSDMIVKRLNPERMV